MVMLGGVRGTPVLPRLEMLWRRGRRGRSHKAAQRSDPLNDGARAPLGLEHQLGLALLYYYHSGDVSPCRMTSVTLHSHAHYPLADVTG